MKRVVKATPKKLMMQVRPSLYEEDFYKWLRQQAKALKAKQFESIDIENLVEEIESLGRSDKRALRSHLVNLMMHLLKERHQPEKQQSSNSWKRSITEAKIQIKYILEDSPSLKSGLNVFIERAYIDARKLAAEESGLEIDAFPLGCPWSKSELLG